MKWHKLKFREQDSWGSGAFGASRGDRKHNGVDLLCDAHTSIQSSISGKVTKVGYPYADDLSYRYVQVSKGGYDYRIFYVSPSVNEGDVVDVGDLIGMSQDLEKRYEGIPNHVHFEIKHGDEYIDPTPVVLALRDK